MVAAVSAATSRIGRSRNLGLAMKDFRKASFRLRGKHPDDLSIERIAQYLRALSDLVGKSDAVRLARVGRGSVLMSLEIDPASYAEVVMRVGGAGNPKVADQVSARAL